MSEYLVTVEFVLSTLSQWSPLSPNGTSTTSGSLNIKTASLSCFKELSGMPAFFIAYFKTLSYLALISSELCSLVGHVIAHIYAIRVRVLGQSSEALLQHLDQQLANWYIGLPKHLRYAAGESNVPPPHVLALHCFFFTALILLHRPLFVKLNQ